MNLPGYDAWKLDNPYDMTAEQEAALEADYQEQGDDRVQVIPTGLRREVLVVHGEVPQGVRHVRTTKLPTRNCTAHLTAELWCKLYIPAQSRESWEYVLAHASSSLG